MDEELEKKESTETDESQETETPVIASGPDPDPEPEPSQVSQSYEPYGNRKKGPKKLLFLFLGVVVVLWLLFNGVKFVASKFQKATPTPSPVSVETPTPSPTPAESTSPSETPTPTPKPTSSVDSATGLDRAKLSVTVKNGSGQAGVGAKAASFLKNLGYNVISTGNADNFNFTNVTIQVKASQKAYLPLLNKDLSSNYSVGSTSSDLSATSSADALVIVGK